MNCVTCGNTNAEENCHSCEGWICRNCAREYDGFFFCPTCYSEQTGEPMENPEIDFSKMDLDFQEENEDD